MYKIGAFIPTLFMACYFVSIFGMFEPKLCFVLHFHWIIVKPAVDALPLHLSVLQISVTADRIMLLPTTSIQHVRSFVLKLAVPYQILTCPLFPFKARGI
jgi:hypothetical protein